MTIKGITFDLEGTVIDVEMVHFQSFTLTCQEIGLGLKKEFFVQKIHQFAGVGDLAITRYLCKIKSGLNENIILERKKFHYDRLLEKVKVRMRPGFLMAFKTIERMGFPPPAIGSLTDVAQANILLVKSGLTKIFKKENIVLSDDVKSLKPKPDVYLETAKRLGIDPAEQLVFEDSPTGVTAAKSAGSCVIAVPVFNTPPIMIGLVKAGATRIFLDWREMNIGILLANLNKAIN